MTPRLPQALVLEDLIKQVVAPRLQQEDMEVADAELAIEANNMVVRLRSPIVLRLRAQLRSRRR